MQKPDKIYLENPNIIDVLSLTGGNIGTVRETFVVNQLSYQHKVEYTKAELSELVNRKLKDDFGDIIDLIPVARGKSGRIWKLKIVGTKKTLTIGKELEIRRALSETHLYSSAFDVVKEGDKFVLNGKGWGHGVGLCQIGAAVMGEQGKTYDEILLFYYRNAKIEKLYE
jgi:SpoIID/LytB domain protein